MRTIAEDKLLLLDRFLASATQICVVVHVRADGDAIGSGMALVRYLTEIKGKKVRLITPDSYSGSLGFLVDRRLLTDNTTDPEAAKDWIRGSDLIVCMDMNSFSRSDSLEPELRASDADKILIDHHLNPDMDGFDMVFSETEISSTAELLFYILSGLPDSGGAKNLPVSIATPLMAGMTTDTNNFANSVYPTTMQMASDLLSCGVNRDELIEQLYNSYRENRMRAMGCFLSEKMTVCPSGVAYAIFDKASMERFDIREGDTEGFVNLPLNIKDVKISIFLKEDDGHFRVSIRSKKGYSAARLAREHFNGGGHENAAGGRLYFPSDIAEPALAAQYIEEKTARFL